MLVMNISSTESLLVFVICLVIYIAQVLWSWITVSLSRRKNR